MLVGQLIPTFVSSITAGGRVINLSIDPQTLARTQLTEASTVGSILPGHLVSAFITAVVPSGLNVKVCGSFDGTIEIAHLGLAGVDVEEKYKIGKKVFAFVVPSFVDLKSRFGPGSCMTTSLLLHAALPSLSFRTSCPYPAQL